MPMDSRAASATRTRSAAANGARRAPAKQLSNKPAGGGGSWAVKIIVLSLIAVAANFGWKKYKAFEASRPKPPPPTPVKIEPLAEPEPEVIEKPKPKPVAKPAKKKRRALTMEERIQMEVEREQVEDTRQRPNLDDPKYIEKLKEEHAKQMKERSERLNKRLSDQLAARAAVAGEIEKARSDAAVKPLAEFHGVKFGDEIKAVPSAWGPVLEGDAPEKGIAYAAYGAPVAKPLGTLAAAPLIWVTPKTHRAFKVEFSRPIKFKPREKHDPETEKIVAALKTELGREAFALRPSDPAIIDSEYVFPMGDTTVRVGEFGGVLKVIAEHEGLRKEALAESKEMHDARVADQADDELLVSTRYPQGEAVNYRGLVGRFREGTPKSFCGLTFGYTPAESAVIINPKGGGKSYFLDYRRDKCKSFKGFTYGRADIDPYRGGLFAVTLYNSEGGVDGVYDQDFFKSVKAALDRQYLVEPKEQKGTREYPEYVYEKGDVTITFGPDRNGGFKLSAVHGTLADIARIAPKESGKASRK